jgi:FMN hydrolase / 5-amino-6-(5-phospho-D-ribitylamino)uracil phosphatase
MIKVFVADMDGTFLRKDHSYDRALFSEMMLKIKQQNKHFVVASGNQWRQIRSFFQGYEKDISIVGENGAVILSRDEVITSSHFDKTNLKALLEYLVYVDTVYLCSGVQHSYVLDSYPQDLKDHIALYARNIQYVNEYEVGDDPILKIALICKDHLTESIMTGLQQNFPEVEVHSSGLGSIDINPYGVNKGNGLEALLNLMELSLSECMAFGDGGNDVSMLERVAKPMVMGNAPTWMHQYGQVIDTNQNQAVLSTILKELSQYD